MSLSGVARGERRRTAHLVAALHGRDESSWSSFSLDSQPATEPVTNR